MSLIADIGFLAGWMLAGLIALAIVHGLIAIIRSPVASTAATALSRRFSPCAAGAFYSVAKPGGPAKSRLSYCMEGCAMQHAGESPAPHSNNRCPGTPGRREEIMDIEKSGTGAWT